jgi:Ca2+/Na+ antiporter
MLNNKAIGVGLALGTIFGAVIHNFAVGIGIGAALGVAVAAASAVKANRDDHRGSKPVMISEGQ